MNPLPTLIGLLVLSLGLAGCHAPLETTEGEGHDHDGHNHDGATLAGDAATVSLAVLDAPATVAVGTAFNMTVDVAAEPATTSEHSGFHYSKNSTAGMTGLTGASFDGASPHVTTSTTYPGTYTIPDWTLTSDMVGTLYLRAHTNAGGVDYWGEEFSIEVTSS